MGLVLMAKPLGAFATCQRGEVAGEWWRDWRDTKTEFLRVLRYLQRNKSTMKL